MADTRHLRKRHQTYYFELAVPRKLRAAYGREKVLVSLQTQDLSKAQELRWALKVKYQNEFARLSALRDRPLGEAEIEEFAQAIYRKTLEDLQADALTMGPRQRVSYHEGSDEEVDPEVQELEGATWAVQDALEEEDYTSVAAEVSTVERQAGQQIPVDSKLHRRLARAILHARHSAFVGRINALSGIPSEAPISFLGPAGVDPISLKVRPQAALPPSDGVRFSVACSRYVAELDRDPSSRLSKQTMLQLAAVHRLFLSWSDDAPLPPLVGRWQVNFSTKLPCCIPIGAALHELNNLRSSRSWSSSAAVQ